MQHPHAIPLFPDARDPCDREVVIARHAMRLAMRLQIYSLSARGAARRR